MTHCQMFAVAASIASLVAAGHATASQAISTQAGCAVCHAVDKKVIGPSWHDIAAKYKGQANAVTMLSDKVRKGGTGVWGTLPMAPTDAKKISDADLKAVVTWILKTP
jgi:cytochrome c